MARDVMFPQQAINKTDKKKWISSVVRVQGDDRLQSLSKLSTNVKAKRMTITQEKIVIPLKKSALESSAGGWILKMVMSKYFMIHTHAANSNAISANFT